MGNKQIYLLGGHCSCKEYLVIKAWGQVFAYIMYLISGSFK